MVPSKFNCSPHYQLTNISAEATTHNSLTVANVAAVQPSFPTVNRLQPQSVSYSTMMLVPNNAYRLVHPSVQQYQEVSVFGAPNVSFQIAPNSLNQQLSMLQPTAGAGGISPMVMLSHPLMGMPYNGVEIGASSRIAMEQMVAQPFPAPDQVSPSSLTTNSSSVSAMVQTPPQVIPSRPTNNYTDHAADPDAYEPNDSGASKNRSFPSKLLQILSDDEYSDLISWHPHGRSWKIRNEKEFEEKVIPIFFRHAKLGSFMRQVNGWGFRRMPHGPDRNSYYHEMFLRGMPHLCAKIRRPLQKTRSTSDSKAHPNLYDKSLTELPVKEIVATAIPIGSTLATSSNSGTSADSDYSGTGSDNDGGMSINNIALTSYDTSDRCKRVDIGYSSGASGSEDSAGIMYRSSGSDVGPRNVPETCSSNGDRSDWSDSGEEATDGDTSEQQSSESTAGSQAVRRTSSKQEQYRQLALEALRRGN